MACSSKKLRIQRRPSDIKYWNGIISRINPMRAGQGGPDGKNVNLAQLIFLSN